MFDRLGRVELVARWWNRRWGRHTRRDIWLYRDRDAWHVRAREGGAEAAELTWPPFADEWAARAWVDRLIAASPDSRDDWKDITRLVRKPDPPEHGRAD